MVDHPYENFDASFNVSSIESLVSMQEELKILDNIVEIEPCPIQVRIKKHPSSILNPSNGECMHYIDITPSIEIKTVKIKGDFEVEFLGDKVKVKYWHPKLGIYLEVERIDENKLNITHQNTIYCLNYKKE